MCETGCTAYISEAYKTLSLMLLASEILTGIISVSYTHLDVYKRQSSNPANARQLLRVDSKFVRHSADSHAVSRERLCMFVYAKGIIVKLVSLCEHSRIGSLFKVLVPPGPLTFWLRDFY